MYTQEKNLAKYRSRP